MSSPVEASPAGTHPSASSSENDAAHHSLVAQPHDRAVEGSVAAAEVVAESQRTEQDPRGRLGRRFNWKGPFFVGLTATAGVAVTYGGIQLLLLTGHILVLIGLALFLAVGMEPAVSWLVDHKIKRGLGVFLVLLLIIGVLGGFLAIAIPTAVTQVGQLIDNAPTYLEKIKDHSSFVGRLNDQFKLLDKVKALGDSSALATGLLGAGVAIFSGLADTLVVLVLTAYFLADFPRLRSFIYRFFPNSRRPRAILIGDDILAKVGGYVLGNLVISVIAGGLTYLWLIVFGVPSPLLLAILVALLDLIPVVGSTAAGVVVCLVALTVSLPVALATVGFFVVYRFVEDYFLVPRIIGKAVDVPGLVTVVAVLVGGALLGVLGALVAIPVAAALLLFLREVFFPRQDLA